MNQTLSRFLPNSAKPSTSNRQATDAPPMTAPDRRYTPSTTKVSSPACTQAAPTPPWPM